MPKKVPMRRKKPSPFVFPSKAVGDAHDTVVLDALRSFLDGLSQWRTTIGPQPRDIYRGRLDMRRTANHRLTMAENAPYDISAHQALRLVAIREQTAARFMELERALMAVPALHTPTLRIAVKSWHSHPMPNSPGAERPTLYIYGIGNPYRSDLPTHLAQSLALLRGIDVSPGDPVWMVKSAQITAPDAATALFIYHALHRPDAALKPSKTGGIPVIRVDQSQAVNDEVLALFNAKRTALKM